MVFVGRRFCSGRMMGRPVSHLLSSYDCESKYFVITTAHSFKDWVVRALSKSINHSVIPEGTLVKNKKGETYRSRSKPVAKTTKTFPTAVTALAARDESHIDKNVTQFSSRVPRISSGRFDIRCKQHGACYYECDVGLLH
jgi:radical SAM superfamily enzyme with C-terminal helix-hairpin-helix motif